MTLCAECEKKINHEGPLCKGCHETAHCIRCRIKLKKLKGLCSPCFSVWETIKEATWLKFLDSA